MSQTLSVSLTAITGLAAIVASLVFRDQGAFTITSRRLGLLLIYSGLALMVWATLHVRSAVSGAVAPRLPFLVTSGPYAYVRHPIYLAATVAMVGVAAVAVSWVGLLATLALFLPAELHRASLEDRALSREFRRRGRTTLRASASFYRASARRRSLVRVLLGIAGSRSTDARPGCCRTRTERAPIPPGSPAPSVLESVGSDRESLGVGARHHL